MTVKIEKKIVGYEIIKNTDKTDSVNQDTEANAMDGSSSVTESLIVESSQNNIVIEPPANVVQMHEKVERPEMLLGSTYKIKTPLSDHALYVTINDIVLNPGTPYEKRRPFEIFINSKNMDHFQWIVALTRIISAVFRKGGDVTFLVEELHHVFDPTGGYFKQGGRYMPSLVADIGDAIESHLRMIGMIVDEEVDIHRRELIKAKNEEYQSKIQQSERSNHVNVESNFPSESQLCVKCHTKAVVMMDGCMTCLNCGESKCG